MRQGQLAWARALETASPQGLEASLAGSQLENTLQVVSQLQRLHEHYVIHVDTTQFLTVRQVAPTQAIVVLRETGAYQALYNVGDTTPFSETTNDVVDYQYTLALQQGHWLVESVFPLSES